MITKDAMLDCLNRRLVAGARTFSNSADDLSFHIALSFLFLLLPDNGAEICLYVCMRACALSVASEKDGCAVAESEHGCALA